MSVLKNTTFNLPAALLAKAKVYAANHGTTMTAVIRAHLEAITEGPEATSSHDPLLAFSQRLLTSREAVRLLGLRDYTDLLAALGEADLPIPMPPPHEIENQAATFVSIWRQS